ncbi:nuclear transport factor 2 family protein [Streptomyces sp. NPDC087300]|uniref:nuclear transport factor 2 family protein n=1 Tax=Streptomyces sp. NPDC087300 TaxID=3365780 RepID=UPI0038064995
MTAEGPDRRCQAAEERELLGLIFAWADFIDQGRFDAAAALLASAEIAIDDKPPVRGVRQIEELLHRVIEIYPDGTPRTHHMTTNSVVKFSDETRTATAKSYFTVFQDATRLPLQPIAAGRYVDAFRYVENSWHFVRRHIIFTLVGDLTRHISL